MYASLYQEQFEGGKIQWRCPDGDILADGTIRYRQTQPVWRLPTATSPSRPDFVAVAAGRAGDRPSTTGRAISGIKVTLRERPATLPGLARQGRVDG